MSYSGIFDSHAHYNDKRFLEDRDSLLPRLHENGIQCIANIGYDMSSSYDSASLAKQYPFVYAVVGVHPHDAKEFQPGDVDRLEALSREEKVVAIGEIGLDYHYDFSPRDIQKQVFEVQLELAVRLNMPVVIHSREATADTLAILKKYRPQGVVHSFSGSRETAEEILKLGMYLGYTGIVTFKNARKVVEAVEVTPPDRLLLETDCPYMAPVPYRGKRCDSGMLQEIAAKVAEIKGMDPQALIDQCTVNTKKMYRI